MRSSEPKPSTASAAATRASVASWEMTTPLLLAVVPEVKRMNAGLSPANPEGPGRSRSPQESAKPSHAPPGTSTAFFSPGRGGAPGAASQPFSSTSRTISAVSVAVRWLASGVRHAPAARRPNAAGKYARPLGAMSPMRCPARTPWEARNAATRSASAASWP